MIYKFKRSKSENVKVLLNFSNILNDNLTFKCNFKYKFKIKKFAPLHYIEKIYIQEILKKKYTLTKVAKILKISRSTLYQKIKKYNIDIKKLEK